MTVSLTVPILFVAPVQTQHFLQDPAQNSQSSRSFPCLQFEHIWTSACTWLCPRSLHPDVTLTTPQTLLAGAASHGPTAGHQIPGGGFDEHESAGPYGKSENVLPTEKRMTLTRTAIVRKESSGKHTGGCHPARPSARRGHK